MPTDKLVFVSHDSADADAFATEFVKTFLLEGCELRDKVFYSGIEGMGPQTGRGLMAGIEHAITTCPIIISLVTPNAIRKGWVMAELGAAWMMSIKDTPTDGIPATQFFPLVVPPMTHDDTRSFGLLHEIVTSSADSEQVLRNIRRALAGVGHYVDNDDKFEQNMTKWLALMSEREELGAAGASAEVVEQLSRAADESRFDAPTLSAFATRASNDLTFAGGVVAKSITSELEVHRSGDDYWVYDLSTVTTYDRLPVTRQKQTFKLEPYILKGLHERSKEPDLSGNDDPYSKPWDITLSPVLASRKDWDRFSGDAEIWVRAWNQDDKKPPAWTQLELTVVPGKELPEGDEAPQDDGAAIVAIEYDAVELPAGWDIIEVKYKNIPHSCELPALYFFASDTCVGPWEFTALSGEAGLETRATSVASWRDVASDQTVLDEGRGTTAQLKGRREMLLLRNDVVLVTVHDTRRKPPGLLEQS